MKPANNFFGTNIKFLRERKKMSQESLSAALGISRAKLAAIELSTTKAHQPEDYISFSAFFKMSIDSMLKVNLSKIGELKLRELEAGNDVYLTGSSIRVLAISVDKQNRENVEYVPVKAKAGYVAGYSDPEFIATLPKYSFPDLPKSGTYRIFPTTGDSMLPIPPQSDIVGRYVQDWTSISPGTLAIVVLNANQDFVFKQIRLMEDKIRLESLNKEYKPYEVDLSGVLEIWEFERFISKKIPERPTEIDELKEMILTLGSRIEAGRRK